MEICTLNSKLTNVIQPNENPSMGRFCLTLLSNVLIQVYQTKANLGLATLPNTKHFFDFVLDLAIVLVCVSLEHAIWEYITEHCVNAKFEGHNIMRKLILW